MFGEGGGHDNVLIMLTLNHGFDLTYLTSINKMRKSLEISLVKLLNVALYSIQLHNYLLGSLVVRHTSFLAQNR